MTSFLKGLKSQKVGVDTMIFIYTFEEHPGYLALLKNFFRVVEKGEIEAVTSPISITECLVQPYRRKDFALAARYMVLFRNFPHLSIIPMTDDVAERAAFLRAHYNLKTPDAIQVATALTSGCRAFLTNDETLASVEGIDILLLDQLS
jgi:predicted nucleic acid-binding protein